ncbi:MAG: hypothetical protein K5769_11880 [Pseudobutyrivibrio sp.]|nr:hypothetical protein [Pseudobutyrivibrio sp.]
MEKMESRTKIEEMKNLVSNNKFADAMSIADTVNWRKVHNINDLISGSESYEAAGKIEEARDLLYLAHERSPIGRMILYKLCMISIKLKDLDEAQEYYNEFVQIAPHDSLKYILKYNISTAKGADTSTLIKILEQLKDNDFIEEWAYELAYLYHKTNQAEKCIALCDEIILWFGDGPVVERALELKMLYQPLDKTQEDKYRHLRQKKDGITEITPELPTGVVLPEIADIKLPEGPERFDTINLQAEIKKNIDEIMKATDTGEVSENIDAIKTLVEEIPYLQVQGDSPEDESEDFSVNDTFQQYLEEGFDGQISLRLADDSHETEEQIEGQMTIEDVLAEWEKTKRAAEHAMEEAKSKELENARAKALREANNVLNRLEGAMSKLDAGMTSADLLKEEYLSNTDEKVLAEDTTEIPEVEEVPEEIETLEASEEQENLENQEDQDNQEVKEIEDLDEEFSEDTPESEAVHDPESHIAFKIPKLSTDGHQKGILDIPVVSAGDAAKAGAAAAAGAAVVHGATEVMEDLAGWKPPTLNENEGKDDVDLKEASQIIADVNDFLQQEIDRLTAEKPAETEAEETKENSQESEITSPENKIIEPDLEEQSEEESVDQELELDILEEDDDDVQYEFAEDIEESEEQEDDFDDEEIFEEDSAEPEINIDDIELPVIQLPPDLFEEEENDQEPEPTLPPVEEVSLEEQAEPEINIENIKVQEPTSADAIEIDEEDLEIFSYFLPISGMRKNIIKAISGAAAKVANPSQKKGNIAIVGEHGSGKTQMATSIIKVLEKKTGYPKGGIGKISGEKLNEKDIQRLYSKIQGGCLIIESAGAISKETAVTLSLLMESDKAGTIIIIEDNRRGIEKAFAADSSFANRFSEKIVIPAFTIDELVSFAKTYAIEAGCTIDDMGVLALYNRINLIGRYNHATTIKEVAEIMDDAIEKSSRGGFFNKPKYDRFGNIILKEKDFDK